MDSGVGVSWRRYALERSPLGERRYLTDYAAPSQPSDAFGTAVRRALRDGRAGAAPWCSNPEQKQDHRQGRRRSEITQVRQGHAHLDLAIEYPK